MNTSVTTESLLQSNSNLSQAEVVWSLGSKAALKTNVYLLVGLTARGKLFPAPPVSLFKVILGGQL